jgi:hypothetical protein
MATMTNNPFGNYTVGQAPGQNQVNLGAMTGNLQNLLQSGDLGNNTPNPMTDIISNGGQSQLGYQNAMANSRMANTGLQSLQDQLAQEEQDWKQQQQQPGLLDFLGLGASAGNTARNIINSADQSGNAKNNALMMALLQGGIE